MSELHITSAHRAARNQASIDLADAGPAPASLRLYDAPGGTLLAQRTLASPCGTLTPEGRIALQAATLQDVALATGSVTWAEWCNGHGQAIASGTVTDESGAGPFKLGGSVGTLIYAGGMVLLAQPALLG